MRNQNAVGRIGIVAAATAAAAVVWLAAHAVGTTPVVSLSGQPPMTITLPMVIITALLAALAGWAALAILTRVSRRGRAVWTALAIAALTVSFAPLTLAHASTGTHLVLAAMHLSVAAVLIPGLRRAGTVTGAERETVGSAT